MQRTIQVILFFLWSVSLYGQKDYKAKTHCRCFFGEVEVFAFAKRTTLVCLCSDWGFPKWKITGKNTSQSRVILSLEAGDSEKLEGFIQLLKSLSVNRSIIQHIQTLQQLMQENNYVQYQKLLQELERDYQQLSLLERKQIETFLGELSSTDAQNSQEITLSHSPNFFIQGKIALWEKADSFKVTLSDFANRKKIVSEHIKGDSFNIGVYVSPQTPMISLSVIKITEEEQEQITIPCVVEPKDTLTIFISRENLFFAHSSLQKEFSRFYAPIWKSYINDIEISENDSQKEEKQKIKQMLKREKQLSRYVQKYALKNTDKPYVYLFVYALRDHYSLKYLRKMCNLGKEYFPENVFVKKICRQ